MTDFDPVQRIEGSHQILVDNQWPNFHDAEVHALNIWRGDIRPDDNVWVGPVIKVLFELCALKDPFRVDMAFHDCTQIKLEDFDHQNAIYDLTFHYDARGFLNNGEPLTPYICVSFEQAFDMHLSFKCFRIEVLRYQNEMNNHDA